MSAHQALYPIRTMCRGPGVSPGGDYAWRRRAPSAQAQANERLLARIRAIHRASRGAYGFPSIHAEFRGAGDRVNHQRVARLMRLQGIVGVTRPKYRATTHRDHPAAGAPDSVQRAFSAERPDQLWFADITYVPT